MMDYDLFISYARSDIANAALICRTLEASGIHCWIAPRDILAGSDYGVALAHAIPNCRALLLLLTKNANNSQWVFREVERAIHWSRPVLTVRAENIEPGEKLEIFVASSQWFDIFGRKPENYLPELCTKVRMLLPTKVADPGTPDPKPPKSPKRLAIWMAAGLVFLLVILTVVALVLIPGRYPSETSDGSVVNLPPVATSESRASFEDLRYRLESLMLKERCSLTDQIFSDLRNLVKSASEEDVSWMRSELGILTSECKLVASHTEVTNEVVNELRKKRLLQEAERRRRE